MKPFSELVVIEVSGSIAGAYAGKLFADFGATVMKVEPPGGDPSRRVGPFLESGSGALFEYLNTGKSSVVLDLSTHGGGAELHRRCEGADIILEGWSPGPADPLPDKLTKHDSLIRVRMSPFGLTGPYRDHRSTPFTDFALGGHMYLTGEPSRTPLQGAPDQTLFAAGTHGFIGALAALHARERTGRRQDVDVSHFEVMASLHQWTTVRYTHGGVIQRRVGNRYGSLHPSTLYECNDGWVAFGAVGNEPLSRIFSLVGLEYLLEEARFASGAARFAHADEFDAIVGPWMLEHSVSEVVELAQAVRAPVAPVNSLADLLGDDHLEARRFWARPEGAETGPRFPGPPFRMSGHPWRLTPAPALTSAVASAAADDDSEWPELASGGTGASDTRNRGALEGITILDLTRVWAGPLATRMLGDMGANVIKIEAAWARGPRTIPQSDVLVSGRYPENQAGRKPWNREGFFNKQNRSKRSLTLRLDTPAGKAIFERLVPLADVVIENYTPRVMPQLGLGYERLKELNPGIVYVSMPGYGWSGPSRDFAALGTTLEPEAGLSSLMGYEDSGPYKSGVAWADPVAAMHGAAAVLMGVLDRDAHPQRLGQAIELAQLEGMICFIGAEVVASQLPGYVPPPRGNRHAQHAPQGCYPCAGDDRWLAMTITSEDEWRALCAVAQMDDSLSGLTLDERRASHDKLDAIIATWTRTRDRNELESLLQGHGIAACAVNDARDMIEHPHLAARAYFADITHPEAGRHLFPGLPIKLSETPARYTRPAPGLGQHNREILEEMLGLSVAQIDALRTAGVIAEEPPG